MTNYNKKYLKYKQKYINLLKGGNIKRKLFERLGKYISPELFNDITSDEKYLDMFTVSPNIFANVSRNSSFPTDVEIEISDTLSFINEWIPQDDIIIKQFLVYIMKKKPLEYVENVVNNILDDLFTKYGKYTYHYPVNIFSKEELGIDANEQDIIMKEEYLSNISILSRILRYIFNTYKDNENIKKYILQQFSATSRVFLRSMDYEVIKRFNFLLIMNNTNVTDNDLTREFIKFYAQVFNNRNPKFNFSLY